MSTSQNLSSIPFFMLRFSATVDTVGKNLGHKGLILWLYNTILNMTETSSLKLKSLWKVDLLMTILHETWVFLLTLVNTFSSK